MRPVAWYGAGLEKKLRFERIRQEVEPLLPPGLGQEPFDAPLHGRGKRGSGAFPVEQYVVLVNFRVRVELQRQLHAGGIEWLNIDAHRPHFIQKHAKPHGLYLHLGADLGGNSCLVQDCGKAACQGNEICLREREKSGVCAVGIGRGLARLFVLLQFFLQGSVSFKQLHRVNSFVIGKRFWFVGTASDGS